MKPVVALALLVFTLASSRPADADGLKQRFDRPEATIQVAEQNPRTEARAKSELINSTRRQAALNRHIERLRRAGKHEEAIPVAQRGLALAERRHGHEHVAVATALTTLGGLYVRSHQRSSSKLGIAV